MTGENIHEENFFAIWFWLLRVATISLASEKTSHINRSNQNISIAFVQCIEPHLVTSHRKPDCSQHVRSEPRHLQTARQNMYACTYRPVCTYLKSNLKFSGPYGFKLFTYQFHIPMMADAKVHARPDSNFLPDGQHGIDLRVQNSQVGARNIT